MPLDNMFLCSGPSVRKDQRAVGWDRIVEAYQGMGFGLLKVVAAIERVEPCVQEELCPFTAP